tara:strand:+ start:464 stop:1159 length:696 start_codon:yes stop_codon:yes gene_type:complete
MRKIKSNRKKSNRKGDAIYQVEVTLNVPSEEMENRHSQMQDFAQQFNSLEKRFKSVLESAQLPSDITKTYYYESDGKRIPCELVTLIRKNHLNVPAAYEAANGLAYLYCTRDEYNVLIQKIRSTDNSGMEKLVSLIIGRLFELVKIVGVIQKSLMGDKYLAGNSKTTRAHIQRTLNTIDKQKLAKEWFKQLSSKNHTKERCYSLIVDRFAKLESPIHVKPDTVKKWFLKKI